VAKSVLDQYEDLWRGRIDRMTAIVDMTEEDQR
jgi:hypothetical protein